MIRRDDYTIRPLTHDDWEAMRDIRLTALQTNPEVYCSNYEREVAFTADDWKERIGGDISQSFGLFHGDEIVGLTGIITPREDPSGKTATLVASYIAPEHRGKGLASLLYEARLRWFLDQPQFEKLTVSHRASNEPSRRANQAWKFRQIDTQEKTWPDGGTEDEVMYEITRTELEQKFQTLDASRRARNDHKP